MSTRGLLLSRFPPGVPLWPGLLLGLFAASAVGWAAGSASWPKLPLLNDYLHPIALFGHGLTLALVFTLFLEGLRLWPRWREAEDCRASERHWAGAAVRDCLDALPARCTFKAYEKKLHERMQRWSARLDRRWLWYYCAALGLFVPGAVLVPLRLRPAPQPQPEPATLFAPLALAALETVVVFLLALRLRIRWGDLLQVWMEAALEGQKRNARLRRQRPPVGEPPVLRAEMLEAPSPPPPLSSHPTPVPPASAFAIPLDEVELVFDNDGYEETEGFPA